MSYVNELITVDDARRHSIEWWEKGYGKVHYKPSWTYDRDRDSYLLYIDRGHEESVSQIRHLFFWCGHHVEVGVGISIKTFPSGESGRHYALLSLDIPLPLKSKSDFKRPSPVPRPYIRVPDAIADDWQSLLRDLKDALAVRGEFGVNSKSTNEVIRTFDF